MLSPVSVCCLLAYGNGSGVKTGPRRSLQSGLRMRTPSPQGGEGWGEGVLTERPCPLTLPSPPRGEGTYGASSDFRRDRMSAMARNDVDVLIAGGGFAGLTLAIALRQALGPTFSVTVADPALGVSHANDERASAIVAA